MTPEPEINFKDLPPPANVPADLKVATFTEPIDSKLYDYPELVKKLREIPQRTVIPTCFGPVDELLDGGFHGGELVILSAATKQGKTTIAQTFSFLQATNKIPTLWFSMEMSWQELTRKFLAMDHDDLLKRFSGQDPPSPLPIVYPIEHPPILSLAWLEKQIAKGKHEYGIQMAYIDHLHFLLPLRDYQTNVSYLIGSVMRELKQIAVRQDIPVLLIAHMKKLEDVTKIPSMNDVRDSSFISQESDFTFIMWRQRTNAGLRRSMMVKSDNEILKETDQDIYTNQAILSLEANRRTGKTKRTLIEYVNSRFMPAKEVVTQEQVDHMADNTAALEETRKALAQMAAKQKDLPAQSLALPKKEEKLTEKLIEAL